MNKVLAHLVFGLIDIAAIYMAYITCKQYLQINQSILLSSDQITFQWPFGVFWILLIIPLLHVVVFVNIFIKSKNIKLIEEISTIIGVVLILVLIIFINIQINSKLKDGGYVYNTNMSKRMTFSMFKTYDKIKPLENTQL